MVQAIKSMMIYRGIGVIYIFTVLCLVFMAVIWVLISIPPTGSDAVTATLNQAVGVIGGLLGIVVGFVCGNKSSTAQRASDKGGAAEGAGA